MDYLKEKFADLEKALVAWKKALEAPFSDLNRDATIQRYEFSFELLWKTVKMYLKEYEGVECNSPKSCFREIRAILDLSAKDIEQCMSMCDDRNLSVHTYSEEMSNALYERLAGYWNTGDLIAKKIKEKVSL